MSLWSAFRRPAMRRTWVLPRYSKVHWTFDFLLRLRTLACPPLRACLLWTLGNSPRAIRSTRFGLSRFRRLTMVRTWVLPRWASLAVLLAYLFLPRPTSPFFAAGAMSLSED